MTHERTSQPEVHTTPNASALGVSFIDIDARIVRIGVGTDPDDTNHRIVLYWNDLEALATDDYGLAEEGLNVYLLNFLHQRLGMTREVLVELIKANKHLIVMAKFGAFNE